LEDGIASKGRRRVRNPRTLRKKRKKEKIKENGGCGFLGKDQRHVEKSDGGAMQILKNRV